MIIAGTAVIVFSVVMFIIFHRFLEKERRKGETFRKVNRKD